MPERTKYRKSESAERAHFVERLLGDIEALELMLDEGWFETDRQRIGAEQEFCLIDYALRPAMSGVEVLKAIDDEHFTTELAKFNLELNLDPQDFAEGCLSRLENDLVQYLTHANRVAHAHDSKVILVGTLPTVRNADLVLDNLTPVPRYFALNEALREARGGDFNFYIRGVDELITSQSTVLLESCNTSFQVHLQIDPNRFSEVYNWAQAISGPVLAAATNSPMLLGKRLWMETRIALFQQSTDPRHARLPPREERARVTFGKSWGEGTLLDIYKELISRFKIMLTPHIEQDALAMCREGKVPKLQALCFHNGTVYRWNRPCYGITDGRPHIRIENRYLPAGPSIVDEVANAAFWLGLMNAPPEAYRDIESRLEFDDAKDNFLKAARAGLGAQFRWIGSEMVPARTLIREELVPLARQGLERASVNADDIDKYLGIIDARAESGRNGSQWVMDAFSRLRQEGSADESIIAITEGIYQRQKAGHPVHKWTLPELSEGGGWKNRYATVEQLMSTDLIVVGEHEPVELVANLMLWSNIHHVPVENAAGELVGIVSAESFLRRPAGDAKDKLVAADIMERDPPTVGLAMSTRHALRAMRDNEIACLPVVMEGKLVGILTDRDFVKIARAALDEE